MISKNTKCNSFDVYICMLICVCSKGPLFWEIKYLYCIVLYHIFMTSPLWLAVGPVSIRRITYKFLNVCPFDYTAVVYSGKAERS